MTDTPETDGLEFKSQLGMMPPYDTVPAEFARRLERERDEAIGRFEAMDTSTTQSPESLGSPLCSPPSGWRETCDGKGCVCAAHDQCECACDADWTPKEVYELTEALVAARDEIVVLKKDAKKQSEIICTRCGQREERGEKPDVNF